MRSTHRRGVTLAIALLILLLLLVMTVGFIADTRTQTAYNAAIKLSSFYRTAAENVLYNYIAELDDWVTADTSNSNVKETWRFGALLQSDIPDTDFPDYGVLIDSSFPNDGFGSPRPEMNASLLPLDFRLYVRNNRDDPAYFLTDADSGGGKLVTPDWDTDGKILVTVQIFNRGEDGFDPLADIPLSTLTALVQPTGVEVAELPFDQDLPSGQVGGAAGSGASDEEDVQELSESISSYN